MAGHLDDGALAELYRRALALLVPSLNEGFGLPVLEAMACGCPVLASRAGALPEVVGDAGLLLPPDDAAAWLRELLALAADGERRAVLSEDGRGRAAAHTWAACATAMLGLYRDAGPVRRDGGAH